MVEGVEVNIIPEFEMPFTLLLPQICSRYAEEAAENIISSFKPMILELFHFSEEK